MRTRDIIMVVVALSSMVLGSYSPQLAEPMAFLPRPLLMLMLFLGFLSVGTDALWVVLRSTPGLIIKLIIVRLFLMPLAAFALFRLVMPEFSLGAFLLGAAPVGVMAGVYSLMLQADTALILVGNITTSLLLPITLPALLYVTAQALAFFNLGTLALPANLSLGGMAVSLCITIIVPFVLAVIIRSRLPRVTMFVLSNAYPLSLFCIIVTNLAIFSQYAGVLHQSPSLILAALGAAWLLSIVMTAIALPSARHMEPRTGLSFIIAYGVINNILIMIMSMQFFSVVEALMSALYLVPCYALLLYYRYYARSKGIAGN